MRRRIVFGLAAGLVLALGIDGSATSDAPKKPDEARLIGVVRLKSADPLFGGFSAIDVGDDGATLLAISDRDAYIRGRVIRDAEGTLVSLRLGPVTQLQVPKGTAAEEESDSEGLAVGAGGELFVSFEGSNRISRFDGPDSVPVDLPDNEAFAELPENEGIEALAIDGSGTLYAVPEALKGKTSPVYQFRGGNWQQSFTIPRIGSFQAVSADFGPDGRMYLLERRFAGLGGFATRLRRFDLGRDGFSPGVVLLQTPSGQHDNLEGLSVWRDAEGLRATMISDDNFFALQVTEIVEYRLPD